MSSGLECRFYRVTQPQTHTYAEGSTKRLLPGWYYMLQNWTCPAGADWDSDATAYGPFGSQEDAKQHLNDHHANPGGSSTIDHANFQSDDVYVALIASAKR